MADVLFNIAKGRMNEFAFRVDNSDPTNAVFVWLATVDTATDDTARGYDTVALYLGDANVAEATNGSYARVIQDDTDTGAPAPDDGNDWFAYDLPDIDWGTPAAGDDWTHVVVGYDSDSTGGDDTNVVPIARYEFSVSPDGSNLTTQVNANGVWRAT